MNTGPDGVRLLRRRATVELAPTQPFAFDATFHKPDDNSWEPGVRWQTVGYILIDVFHAFDQLAHISPWEQRIYSRLLLGTPVDDPAPVRILLERIARWSPWRALAVHYLWEDLFWRHQAEPIDWLTPMIRL